MLWWDNVVLSKDREVTLLTKEDFRKTDKMFHVPKLEFGRSYKWFWSETRYIMAFNSWSVWGFDISSKFAKLKKRCSDPAYITIKMKKLTFCGLWLSYTVLPNFSFQIFILQNNFATGSVSTIIDMMKFISCKMKQLCGLTVKWSILVGHSKWNGMHKIDKDSMTVSNDTERFQRNLSRRKISWVRQQYHMHLWRLTQWKD